ncbi:hypothetical protein SMACR_12874 [Sordaria macrospora]|uniref:Uncharacterized protein n=1 Tax=Sordaria macrospora TaxID=5147 RepID=A0A8S8ZH01_SORMA|nr:hypothetical protein SMACR_12874 [Sordaria macrospora]WPJ63638.1 hypothetical protein SMAC4_12874 [Sordaria macrospora]
MGLPLPPSQTTSTSSPPGPWLNFFSSSHTTPTTCTLCEPQSTSASPTTTTTAAFPPSPSPLDDISISNGILIKHHPPARHPKPNPSCSWSFIGFGASSKNHHAADDQIRGFKQMQAQQHWIQKVFNQPCSSNSIETTSSIRGSGCTSDTSRYAQGCWALLPAQTTNPPSSLGSDISSSPSVPFLRSSSSFKVTPLWSI